ncbi:uncharacterized protein METZ01_LOCUS386970, partial [marine metagenome]
MTRYRKSWTEVIEEVILNEALKPKDQKVIDAFYDRKELEGKLLSTDGDKLEKLGMGRDTVAVWKGHKIEITSSSAVKSDDVILRYMKKSIPKLNFDPKSYKKYFGEEVEEKVDMDKAGYGGSRHKKIEKDKYNKKRKGQGIEDDLDEGTAYPPTIENLRMIVKDKQHQKFMFPKGQALVDLFTASAMVQVYDALKPATKKKFEDMIKSKEGFMKSQAFAMK